MHLYYAMYMSVCVWALSVMSVSLCVWALSVCIHVSNENMFLLDLSGIIIWSQKSNDHVTVSMGLNGVAWTIVLGSVETDEKLCTLSR